MDGQFELNFELSKNPYMREKSDFARGLVANTERETGENRTLSPLSYELALMLLGLTTEGDSLNALEQAVGYKKSARPVEQLQQLIAGFKTYVKGKDTDAEIEVSFGVASNSGLQLDEKAVDPVRDHLQAFWKEYDFKTEGQKAVQEINQWVAGTTKGKVKELVTSIPDSAIFVLLNSLYLKASWFEPFKDRLTNKMKFRKSDGTSVDMQAMKSTRTFEYVDHTSFQAISLGLNSPDLVFWAIRPKVSIDEVYKVLSAQTLGSLFGSPSYERVELSLPKFKFKTQMDLTQTLDALGMGVLRKSPNMDMSGFFEGKHDIVISKVIQGSFFALDENGIEAASATAMMARAGSAPNRSQPHSAAVYVS
ncbi:MAG: serpin family protein, partial [Pseudomonadota bacterium]